MTISSVQEVNMPDSEKTGKYAPNVIQLDNETIEKLQGMKEPQEWYDEKGNLLGRFYPTKPMEKVSSETR